MEKWLKELLAEVDSVVNFIEPESEVKKGETVAGLPYFKHVRAWVYQFLRAFIDRQHFLAHSVWSSCFVSRSIRDSDNKARM